MSRTIDVGVEDAEAVVRGLDAVGIDLDDVGRTLEDQGVAAFHESFAHLLAALDAKAAALAPT